MKNLKNIMVFALILIAGFVVASSLKSYNLLSKTVNVYFVRNKDSKGIEYVATKRIVLEENNRVGFAIKELLKGPSQAEKLLGYYSEIPSSTKVLSVREARKQVTVDLSKEFVDGGGSNSLELRTGQLIRTAVDAAGKKDVFLEIEGKRAEVLGGEGLIIEQPLGQNIKK